MNYAETIHYLYHKLPMFSNMGCTAFKKDLTNIRILCERLGNPHERFKSIHIAGTNGKGSVSHMLASILQTSGYKTGLYTSPHLRDFRERIRIDGHMVNEDFVVRFVERIKPVIEEIEPSFFEITVAMAFEYFAEQKVDVAVVEVGLGGRLDSTNIVLPELSVITNIGLDHTNILGETLEAIAAEKAGIIKEHIPVVIGEKHSLTAPVFEQIANKNKSAIHFSEAYYAVQKFQLLNKYIELHVKNIAGGKISEYQLDLPGIYQTKNVLTVLTAIDILRNLGWKIEHHHIEQALRAVKKLTGLSGRWEVIKEHPTVVLEVAHNEDGIRQMLHHLHQLNFDRLHVVFGMVKDKDISVILSLLPKNATYYFTQAHIQRALDANELRQLALEKGLTGKSFEHVNIAIEEALSHASSNDLILVCGSIFLVAEVELK